MDKKKKREKEVRKKILRRREGIRARAREEKLKENERREIQKVTNKIEGRTIINYKNEQVMNQLEHNLSILQALEEERKILKEAQEAAPMINQTGLPKSGLKASADVQFIPANDVEKNID